MDFHFNWEELLGDPALKNALQAQADTPADFKAAVEANNGEQLWEWLSSAANDLLTVFTDNGGMGGAVEIRVYALAERFFVYDGGACAAHGPYSAVESIPDELPELFSLQALAENSGADIDDLISIFEVSVESKLPDPLTFMLCSGLVVPGMTIKINQQKYALKDAGLARVGGLDIEPVSVLRYDSEGGAFGVNLLAGKYYTFSDWDPEAGPFDTVESACAANPELWAFGDEIETGSATHELKSTLPVDQVLRLAQRLVSVGDVLVLNGRSFMRSKAGYVLVAADD